MKVRYRRKARVDIEHIFLYVAERNPPAAADVVAHIRHTIDSLGAWPQMGHAGRDLGTYELVVSRLPYVIVYEIDKRANEIAIIAVFHGAQDR